MAPFQTLPLCEGVLPQIGQLDKPRADVMITVAMSQQKLSNLQSKKVVLV